MALTARALWLVLLGIVPVVLRPAASTVWLWLLLCAVVVARGRAGSRRGPASLHLERELPPSVRLGESVRTSLLVTNPGIAPGRRAAARRVAAVRGSRADPAPAPPARR